MFFANHFLTVADGELHTDDEYKVGEKIHKETQLVEKSDFHGGLFPQFPRLVSTALFLLPVYLSSNS